MNRRTRAPRLRSRTDEPLVAEAHNRLAHGAAAQPEPLGQLLLDQPLAGRELAGDDGRMEGTRRRRSHAAKIPTGLLTILLRSGVAEHPVPSTRARELVRGGFDPHVHVAPDFAPRRITDLELARRCLELGLAGFGLKSHYTATAERAAVVTAAVPGVRGARHDHAATTRSAG